MVTWRRPGAKQREGNVELGRSVRERPEDDDPALATRASRADFGRVAKIEGRIL